ncbi:hypothetical protein C0431_12480 [bacterium]|nr:hypothetical protein [bacterium]
MSINHVFDVAKKAWMAKIESLTYQDVLEGDVVPEVFQSIFLEVETFKKVGPIAHYFDRQLPIEEQPTSEPVEIDIPTKAVYPDDHFRFKRLVRGGELINLNNESLYMDQVYVPESSVRDFGLVTGDIVEASVYENTPGKYTNRIHQVISQVEPHVETAPFVTYAHLLVERNGFGELYAAKYASGGFAKNDDGDMLQFRISINDERRYGIHKGSLVDIAVDQQSGYTCVSFNHKQEELTDSSSKTKKAKKEASVQDSSDEESGLYDGIEYDLKSFEGKTLVLIAGEHLVPRYEQVFQKDLGMNLLQFNIDRELPQMVQSIENGPDYAIACPSVVGHDATESFKDAAKKTKVDYTFSKYDGPKQVLLKLVELDQRVKERAG